MPTRRTLSILLIILTLIIAYAQSASAGQSHTAYLPLVQESYLMILADPIP
jgi:hypothetical protein